jgi:hypothetical protein
MVCDSALASPTLPRTAADIMVMARIVEGMLVIPQVVDKIDRLRR